LNTFNRSRQAGKVDIVVVIIAVSLVIMALIIILPAIGAARRTSRSLQNSTQARGIHGAMVLFAQGNNNFYPGFNGHDLTSFSTPVGWC
jgi:type II secretory pathway pseudopilin PulG